MLLRTYNLIRGYRPLRWGLGPPAGTFTAGADPQSVRNLLNNNFESIAYFVETTVTGVSDVVTALWGSGRFSGLDYSTDGLTLTISSGSALIGLLVEIEGSALQLPANSTSTIYIAQDGSVSLEEPEMEYIVWGTATTDDSTITEVNRATPTIIPAQLRLVEGVTTASITTPSLVTYILVEHEIPLAVQGFISAAITSGESDWCYVQPTSPELWTPTTFWLAVGIKPEYWDWYYYYWTEEGPILPYYPLPSDMEISWERTGLTTAG